MPHPKSTHGLPDVQQAERPLDSGRKEIPRGTVDRVKREADLAGVLARLGLEPADGRRKYRCPFHDERTPSFVTYDGPPRFQCFGCGTSGDALDLAQRLGAMTFPDAVRWVAGVSGLSALDGLDPSRPPGRESRPDSTPANPEAECLHDAAARFYAAALDRPEPDARAARAYLRSRGIGPETQAAYGLGFAPAEWAALTEFLLGAGADENGLVTAGLARRRNGRPTKPGRVPRSRRPRRAVYDLFRGRIVFPLAGADGRVVGFGGRVVPALAGRAQAGKRPPKYLNSPDSEHFSKSHLLFGLPQVARTAASAPLVVLVEGYLDVLALAEAGVPALAPCGTAFSAEQATALVRIGARRVLVAFDGDAAGQKATREVLTTLIAAGATPYAVRLEDTAGEPTDPAELVLALGPRRVRRWLGERAVSAVEWLAGEAMTRSALPATTPSAALPTASTATPAQIVLPPEVTAAEDGATAAAQLAPTLMAAPDPFFRAALLGELAARTRVPFPALASEVDRGSE
jgi:DNA primase